MFGQRDYDERYSTRHQAAEEEPAQCVSAVRCFLCGTRSVFRVYYPLQSLAVRVVYRREDSSFFTKFFCFCSSDQFVWNFMGRIIFKSYSACSTLFFDILSVLIRATLVYTFPLYIVFHRLNPPPTFYRSILQLMHSACFPHH